MTVSDPWGVNILWKKSLEERSGIFETITLLIFYL